MPPIQLSRHERASLHKILEHPCQIGEIPADHQEKFINYHLARKRVLLLFITPLGQIEALRHSFGSGRVPAGPPHPMHAAPRARKLLAAPVAS
jgi:hypothetical protein